MWRWRGGLLGEYLARLARLRPGWSGGKAEWWNTGGVPYLGMAFAFVG